MSTTNAIKDILRRIREKRTKSGETRANESILTIEEICTALRERGDFTGSYEDLVKHVRMFFGEMSHQLSGGFAGNTGYFSVHPVADKTRFSFRARSLLRRLARYVVIKVDEQTDLGKIDYFTDMGTGMVNERITPGSIFIATGSQIKIEGVNEDCGVWFVLMVDASLRYKVMNTLIENSSNRVSGIVPIIPAGKYAIEIITQYTDDGVLHKEPRTIRGGFPLRNYKILSMKDEEQGE